MSVPAVSVTRYLVSMLAILADLRHLQQPSIIHIANTSIAMRS